MAVRESPMAAAAPGIDVAAWRRSSLWTMLAAKLVGGWGLGWDIRWHLVIGRDSFWIPPHVLTYAAVSVMALVAFAALAVETRAARDRRVPGAIRIAGLSGAPGLHLAAWGMAITIVAAPIDDLWHRLFGLDVTLWSPPHLLGLFGAQVNTLGCLFLAGEIPGLARRERVAAVLAGSTLMLGAFEIIVDPAVQTAFRRGGAFLFSHAVLGSLAFAFTLALAGTLTGWRWSPAIVAGGAVLVQLTIIAVGDVGFAVVKPVSALQAAIAADPDSALALAHEMSRRNGAVPGRSITMRLLPVLPAIALAAVDVRRRPRAAAVAFGAGLWAVSGVVLARAPALAHVRPDVTGAAVALALSALAALAGTALARALAREPV